MSVEPLAIEGLAALDISGDRQERHLRSHSDAKELHISKAPGRRLAVIERLNEDDLAMIFGCTQQTDSPKERLLTSLRIASVCRDWRALALDTSALWTAICLCSYREQSLLLLDMLLTRSGMQPLDIVISSAVADVAPAEHKEAEKELFPRIMEALVSHIRRWRTVDMDPLFISSVRDLLSPWQGSADALQKLSISSVMADSYWKAFAMFCADFYAPNLLSLSLHRTRCLPRTDLIEQCFPALEELTIEDQCVPLTHHPWTLMNDLQPLKHLRRLELSGAPVYNSLPNDVLPMLLFPALEELSFARMFVPSVEDFLAIMHAPVLATLHLLDIKLVHPHTTFVPIVHNHRDRFPMLKTVRVTDVTDLKEFVWDLDLGAFQSLDLQFSAPLSVNATLGFLAKRHFAAVNYTAVEIWPLRKLSSITVLQEHEIPITELRQIVENRRGAQPEPGRPGSPAASAWRPPALKELHVRTFAELSDADEEWFKTNVEVFAWTRPSSSECNDSDLGLLKLGVYSQ